MSRRISLELTEAQVILLAEALDSHVYWQLSSPEYRHDSTVVEPGTDDASSADQIRAVMDLHRLLQAALGVPLDEPIGPWGGSDEADPSRH